MHFITLVSTQDADSDATTLDGVGNANDSIDEDVEGVGGNDEETAQQQQFHPSGRSMRMNCRHIKDTFDGAKYSFATDVQLEAFCHDTDTLTPTVTTFLHAQTEYGNSLSTYDEVNTAIQHDI